MDQITLRVQPEVKESLEEEATENDQTLSEYMRTLIQNRNQDSELAERHDRLRDDHERLRTDHDRLQDDFERVQSENERLQNETEHVQTECEQLRTENDRIKREKQMILDQRDEVTALREYVHDEQDKQRRRDQANVLQRARWWLVGMDDSE